MQKAQRSLQPSWALMKARVLRVAARVVGGSSTAASCDGVQVDEAVGEGELVGLPVDEVGGEGVDLVEGRGLEQAAGQGDGGVGREAAREPHEVARLLVGDVGDAAGVDDDGVGVGLGREAVDDVPAGVAQAARHRLGVGDVELAAEGEDGGGGGGGPV